MTPYEIECERERRDQEQGQIAAEWYQDGQNDAAFGRRPHWSDEAYLEGYIAKLKQLPKNPNGSIKHYCLTTLILRSKASLGKLGINTLQNRYAKTSSSPD